MRLRIYNNGEFKGSVNDECAICIHESRGTEPSEYIIKYDGKFYLGTYPRMEGHRAYGEIIGEKTVKSLLEESYCDNNEYEKYFEMDLNGEELFDNILN